MARGERTWNLRIEENRIGRSMHIRFPDDRSFVTRIYRSTDRPTAISLLRRPFIPHLLRFSHFARTSVEVGGCSKTGNDTKLRKATRLNASAVCRIVLKFDAVDHHCVIFVVSDSILSMFDYRLKFVRDRRNFNRHSLYRHTRILRIFKY